MLKLEVKFQRYMYYTDIYMYQTNYRRYQIVKFQVPNHIHRHIDK